MRDFVLQSICDEILRLRDEQNIIGQQNYFKEPIKTNGLKSHETHMLAEKYFNKEWAKDRVFNLCEELWQTGYMEQGFIACDWSYYLRDKYEKNDFVIFDRWVKNYINNWATTDSLCTHTIGEFITMYPEFVKELKKWSKSENRWVRRASAVSFIIPAKIGLFKDDIFDIADVLLEDKDDMVQKGYGWALKSLSTAGYAHQKENLSPLAEEVYNFVVARVKKMPRTAFRYAVEKLPNKMRKEAMNINFKE
ncbi:MAG: DNA alkylation repair protein [Rickettsiales bacterium]|jgi:3-methyladenine DNA glycosylase AlkD|nr:DNA alkylation repair protein [Rickettsiales bacterium]